MSFLRSSILYNIECIFLRIDQAHFDIVAKNNNDIVGALEAHTINGSVPMFPGTYVPRCLCSPVPMLPGTDVPRFLLFNSGNSHKPFAN